MASTLQLGPVTADLDARVAWRDGVATALTGLEARLLRYIAECAPEVATREGILREVWGRDGDSRSRALGQAIRRLRVKIEVEPSSPRFLLSEVGVGYRLVLHVEEPEARPARGLVDRDSFVGRSAELEAMRDWVESGFRLVTIVGFGGMGKSRLARTFLRQHACEGVFVPLAHARTSGDVIQAVAHALDVRTTMLDGTAGPVGSHLACTPRVVVLDGVEQVLADAARLIDRWLDLAPRAVFIVTSRAPTRVAGERLIRLGPLEPDDARQLWQDRVPLGVPGPSDAPADVARLVQRLEGIPLAIELAAARRSLASAHALHDLLSTILREAHPHDEGRHATLRACVEWSWQLLGPLEQAALSQFAVFRGGASVDAALSVIRLPDGSDPWPALQSLLDQSMVTCCDVHGQLRLDLLDTVREYLAEIAPVPDVARVRHLALFTEAHRAAVLGTCESGGLARARLDLPNLSAAYEHAAAPGLADARVAVAVSLVVVLGMQHPAAAERIADDALAVRGGGERDRQLLTLFKAGQLCLRFDADGARALLEPLLASDPELRGRALIELGNVAYRLGDLREARRRYAEAVEQLTGHTPVFFGRAVENLAVVQAALGDAGTAEAAHLRALEINQRHGSKFAEASSAGNLAVVLFARGATTEAHELACRALRLSRDVGAVHAVAIETARVAWVRLHDAALGPWQELAEEAVSVADQGADPRWWAETRIVLATGDLYAGRIDRAPSLLDVALSHARTTQIPMLLVRTHRTRALLAMLLGRFEEADQELDRAREALPEGAGASESALVLACRAELRGRAGDHAAGHALLAEAAAAVASDAAARRPDLVYRMRSARHVLEGVPEQGGGLDASP